MRVILYHDDFDGVCSAAIAWRKFEKEAMLFTLNYHELFPFSQLTQNDEIWLLDYSISVEDMVKLMEITKNINWIDHHKSSLGMYPEIIGIRNGDKSACELTWEYLNPKLPMSWAIKYIGDRDIWAWKFGDATRHFYNGLQMEKDSMNPKAEVWDILLATSSKSSDEYLDDMMHEGMIIEKYKMLVNKQLVDKWAYQIEFEGHECLAINCSNTIDRLSNTMLECGKKICIIYIFTGEKYNVSLFSNDADIDVEIIAKKYGGGGHKGAAGFVARTLPFNEKL